MLKKIFNLMFRNEVKEEINNTLWVRIISTSKDTNYWYRFKHGHHYLVTEHSPTTYRVISNEDELLFIDKAHTVIEDV